MKPETQIAANDAPSFTAFLRNLATTPQLSTKQLLDYKRLAAGGVILDDNIEIISELGRGGMGRVFLARDRSLERDVAVKFVNPAAVAKDARRSLEVLAHEARATARLNHPNIVAIHRHGSWKGFPYIVFELIHGISLADHLAQGPLPMAEAVSITRQLLLALRHAHEAGVLHRDLKPSNIMLRDDGLVTILDFGISSVEWAEPRDESRALAATNDPTSRRSGTPAYMAPEQWRGGRQDQRTDLWAVGLLLAEMVGGGAEAAATSTASAAPRADTPSATGDTVGTRVVLAPRKPATPGARPRQQTDLDRQRLGAVAGVVSKATASNPDQRFANAAEMLDALEQATARRPSHQRWLRRAIAVAAMMVTAGWFFAARVPVAPVAAAPVDAITCEWSGSWATLSTSPSGRNLADVDLTGSDAHMTGSYDTGTLVGSVLHSQEPGAAPTTRFDGKWSRSDGSDSGGACQYGRFTLQARHDAAEGCVFTGHWSYCDDDPLGANGWWWRGRKLDH